MTYTQSTTRSATYTVADIRDVVRQLTTDLKMMARSSRAMTEDRAADYGHDIEILATEGYLEAVDVTLRNAYGIELRAVRYDVDEETGAITSSRPGGVLWPPTEGGDIRIVLYQTREFSTSVRERLRRSWGPSFDDTSHPGLKTNGGRDYASNGYGLHRKDWS